jgi:hypothetical protein
MIRRFSGVGVVLVVGVVVFAGCDAIAPSRNPDAEFVRRSAQACRQDQLGDLTSPPGIHLALAMYRLNPSCDDDCRREIDAIRQENDLEAACASALAFVDGQTSGLFTMQRWRAPHLLGTVRSILRSHWLLLFFALVSLIGQRGRGWLLTTLVAGGLAYGVYRGILWLSSAVAVGVWLGLGASLVLLAGGYYYSRLTPRFASPAKLALSLAPAMFGIYVLVGESSTAVKIASGIVTALGAIIGIGEALRERRSPSP